MIKKIWKKLGILFISLVTVINLSLAIVLFNLMKKIEASSVQLYAFSDYLSVHANQMTLLGLYIALFSLFLAVLGLVGYQIIKESSEAVAKDVADKVATNIATKVADKAIKEYIKNKEQEEKSRSKIPNLSQSSLTIGDVLPLYTKEWRKE